MRKVSQYKNPFDLLMLSTVLLLMMGGLGVLYSFSGSNNLFSKQTALVALSLIIMLLCSYIDFRFLRKSWVVMTLYGLITLSLAGLIVFGSVFSGAQSWFNLGIVAIQPAEFAKLALIIVLAKYFSKRHVEIASLRHIVVSGLYAALLFFLVLRQPDFGSAIILFCIWFGMVLLAGINWKHLAGLAVLAGCALLLMWNFVFSPYQQQRIITFMNPQVDVQGSGYNSAQAAIAVGSGGFFGKGIGFGSQSRLQFLPQYQTDFMVAAFAEEWGFIGMIVLLLLYFVLIARIVQCGIYGETNFEMLFAGGVAIYFITHVVMHTGINIGLLPVTGITIPFMSYGGSHLVTESLCVGLLLGMRRYRRTVHRQNSSSEILTYN